MVVLSGVGAATDQAARAERCALAVRAVLPDAPMALATGLGGVSGRWIVGEVIDRAVRLATRAEAPCGRALQHAHLVRGAPADMVDPRPPIRVDDVTAGLLGDRFLVDPDPAGASVLLRDERAVEEAKRTLLGKATPFVGRERDLATLRAIVDDALEEPRARSVLVTAPAGFGKSRLRRELCASLPAAADVWVGRGDPIRAGAPFGILGDAIRHACVLGDGDRIEVRRGALSMRVARHIEGAEGRRIAEFLGEIVGVPFPDDDSVELRAARSDPMLMADRTQRAWEAFLEAECEDGPIVLVLEDLHWGDLPTVRFASGALRALAERPFVLLAFARPEVHDLFPRLGADRAVHEIRLSGLGRSASERLVRDVLGEVEPAALARIVDRAEGNAFYLEELIRAEAQAGAAPLPGTVMAMVEARIERLSADDRLVLRAGSVFGQTFWRGGVAALVGAEVARDLPARLDDLVERELVVRRRRDRLAAGSSDAEYGFRHALVREAAYAMLTAEDRALGHRLAAEWLEATGGETPLALAEHFERGGEPGRAVGFYLRAAAAALDASDLGACLDWSDRAAGCGAQGETLGILRAMQAEAHRWRGETGPGQDRGKEAIALLPPRGARWYLAVGETASAAGRRRNVECLEDLAKMLLDPPPPEAIGAHAIASACTAISLLYSGRYALGEALLAQVEGEADAIAARDPAAVAWIDEVRATRAQFAGDVSVFIEAEQAAADRYEAIGHQRNALEARSSIGYAYLLVGAHEWAESTLREVLAAAERSSLHRLTAVVKENLGMAVGRQGRWQEALAIEGEAAATFAAQDDRRMEAGARSYLAAILAASGDLVTAEREARAAVALASETRPLEAHALATLAQVLLGRGSAAEALALSRQAMAILDELGSIEEGEALLRLVHVESLAAAGQAGAASAALDVARAKLLERAAQIRDEALRRSFLERVPEHARTLELQIRSS